MGNEGTGERDLEAPTLARLEASVHERFTSAPVRRAFIVSTVAQPVVGRRGDAPTKRELPPR